MIDKGYIDEQTLKWLYDDTLKPYDYDPNIYKYNEEKVTETKNSISIEDLTKKIEDIRRATIKDTQSEELEKENKKLRAYNTRVKKCIKELIRKYKDFKESNEQ